MHFEAEPRLAADTEPVVAFEDVVLQLLVLAQRECRAPWHQPPDALACSATREHPAQSCGWWLSDPFPGVNGKIAA